VLANTAKLSARIDPNALTTSYHFDYISKAAYEANLAAAKDPFTGAAKAPAGTDPNLGSLLPVTVNQQLFGLLPDTAYRYRALAKNSAATTPGPTLSFSTQPLPGASLLADGRGWEMVSPVDKNGGAIAEPETIAAGGVLQAAAQGGSVTYGSSASFGPGAQGAPTASQYLATRSSSGWATQNLTVAIFSGSFDTETQGVPYQLFSQDLSRGLLLNGKHCRGEEEAGCPVANPPLAGTDALAGYQDYYLRQGAGFEALVGASELANTDISASAFELSLAGTSEGLSHVVLSSCAALTPDATEVPLGEGCDPGEPNLYLWSQGGGLELVNAVPGAKLAAQGGALSTNGERVYWSNLNDTNLYLREASITKQVDEDAGEGGTFQSASSDGGVAFFSKGGHLWRYVAQTDTATDLTPGGEVVGVLGSSPDGTYAYYQDASALKLWHNGATTTVAPGADAALASNYPPANATSRVSGAGTLLFASKAPLTAYDNTDLTTGLPDTQLYLHDPGAPSLTCISCNPTASRPLGPSSIPGSIANGSAEGSTNTYKPRVLSTDGRRAFFDSNDALVLSDTNNDKDAYQWEAGGEGSCARPAGCVSLISSGRAEGGASFVDASADGAEAFFLTDGSLVGSDPGSVDLYVARVGGGFPILPVPIPCNGDACQSLPPEPVDPGLGTLASGPGNPKVHYKKLRGAKKSCGKGSKRGSRCKGKGQSKANKHRTAAKGGVRR
jgi:hypothetical protein